MHNLRGAIAVPRIGLPPSLAKGPPAELRARAQRIRDLARNHVGDEAEPRMLALADDLDARADALERSDLATMVFTRWVV